MVGIVAGALSINDWCIQDRCRVLDRVTLDVAVMSGLVISSAGSRSTPGKELAGYDGSRTDLGRVVSFRGGRGGRDTCTSSREGHATKHLHTAKDTDAELRCGDTELSLRQGKLEGSIIQRSLCGRSWGPRGDLMRRVKAWRGRNVCKESIR